MFNAALRIVEFFDPETAKTKVDARTGKAPPVHYLSKAAYETIKEAEIGDDSFYAQMLPALTGPIAVLTFPTVSPQHVAAALSVLSPSPPQFPAPTRRKNPGYYDPVFQNAVSKLLLVGGRAEGTVFDADGVKWMGGIQGGMDGLRAQLVAVLQGAGLGIAGALEGTGRSLWLAMEGRKMMMEDSEANAGRGEEKA